MFATNIILSVLWQDSATNIFTALSGWVSGIATVVLGGIAFWQSKKYRELSDKMFDIQSRPKLIATISGIVTKNVKTTFEKEFDESRFFLAGYYDGIKSQTFTQTLEENSDIKLYFVEIENRSDFMIFDLSPISIECNKNLCKIFLPLEHSLKPLEKATIVLFLKNEKIDFVFNAIFLAKNHLMNEYMYTFTFQGHHSKSSGTLSMNIFLQKVLSREEWDKIKNHSKLFELGYEINIP